jgi:hypothetical protein
MTTRIAYTAAGTGQQISDFVNDVQTVLAKGRRLKAKLDSMSYGNDWAAVEAEVGGMVAGTGQTLWTLIATAMGQIDSAQVAELARLDKQG